MDQSILIVDDEQSVRRSLREFFEGFGYQVVTAGSGQEALEALAERPVKVLFLDLNMPGMTGLELCQRLRQDGWGGCIYALTGYGQLFTSEQCREAGFNEYFNKPVDLHMLHNAALRGFENACGL